MQANDAIHLQRLKQWFDVTWDPVGDRLSFHGPYQQDLKFLQPSHETAEAYVYFTVHTVVAALGKGGKIPKPRGPPKDSADNYCPTSIH